MNKYGKKLFAGAVVILSLGVIQQSFAEIAIIVHPDNKSATNAKVIKRIFLGKVKTFDGGASAMPVELPEGSADRTAFNSNFLKKSDSQMKSYWGRLVFTGKATAPEKASSDDDMIEKVSSNPQYIGYVDSSKVTSAVKIIHSF